MRTQDLGILAIFLLTVVDGAHSQNASSVIAALSDTGAEEKVKAATPGSSTTAGSFVVRTTIQVDAQIDRIPTEDDSPHPLHATAAEILPSAGTYGDFSRYLQTFPGVVLNSDESDDIIVRGGNPLENLFVVDGIEIPNINHIASEETTGGLVSMIDTAAIRGVDLYTGGYDASYEERLSSVVDIRTRLAATGERHAEADFGFIGVGGVGIVPIGRNGSLLASAHRSILNLVTSDIGLGGTPVYSNLLTRAQLNPTPRDELMFLSLSGFDSINIRPGGWSGVGTAADCDETSTINMQYSGWRTTNGFHWHHVFSQRLYSVFTVSDSEQQENVSQQDQFFEITGITSLAAEQLQPIQVYHQLSRDGQAELKYDAVFDSGKRWSVIAGSAGYLNRTNYTVAQLLGMPSPLTTDPAITDADSFTPNFLAGASGSYVEATFHPVSRWGISGGGRVQTFAVGAHITATPRLNSTFRLSQHSGLHAAFGEYAQMPPMIDVESWPQNHDLLPIRVRHIIAGADLYSGAHARIGVEAYQKNYRDYPVSTQFPSLSLANMVDNLGQQFLWIPLISKGTGLVRGLEVSGAGRLGSHLSGQANVAYAKTTFAGLDDLYRPGNFDFPIVGSTSGTYTSGKHYEVSWRYEYTSGKPYTPYQLADSVAQNRPIYDLSRLNANRGPVYSRFDFEMDRSFFMGPHRLTLYAGLQNAWDRKNFLGYYWMPRDDAYWGCGADGSNCLSKQYDMVRFPDFGVRYVF